MLHDRLMLSFLILLLAVAFVDDARLVKMRAFSISVADRAIHAWKDLPWRAGHEVLRITLSLIHI